MNGLKFMRTIKELSMEEVAKQCSVTKQMVNNWEHGRNKLTEKNRIQLAEFFGCPEILITAKEVPIEKMILKCSNIIENKSVLSNIIETLRTYQTSLILSDDNILDRDGHKNTFHDGVEYAVDVIVNHMNFSKASES